MSFLSRLTLALSLLVVTEGASRAQFASPGELARAHSKLEGISNCIQCHQSKGKQLGPEKCLECHKELKDRIAKERGFHGRLPAADRETCQKCHHEHQGTDAALIEWPEGGREKFNHSKVGWALEGKHAQQKCASCHEPRLMNPEAKALSQKGRTTYLGLGTACLSCHFDEHRGQEGRQCEKCHTESGWKPASKFKHSTTDYPLTGKHAAVECIKCHPSEPDEANQDVFPKPRSNHFQRYAAIEHNHCRDCHNDPHGGKFSGTCESCHSVEGWQIIRDTTKERAFHDKTNFPLRGAHAAVICKSCHGPFPGKPAKFKGLAHAKCMDCHADSHSGQLARPACERCHTVQTFLPSKFDLEEHQQTRYPLQGSHLQVACSGCHKTDQKIAQVAAHRRHSAGAQAWRPSPMIFKFSANVDRCDSCHRDPHAGQFKALAAGCLHCHDVSAFEKVNFDHQKESRFPLTGKHATTPCASCHRAAKPGDVVRYRPLSTACASCHADVHVGQFENGDCARCHQTNSFKETLFKHDDPTFTSFTLEGKHQQVKCGGCHTAVSVGGGKTIVRYRPLPRACEDCHVDTHKGAFKGFQP